jgi:hypothetical protein
MLQEIGKIPTDLKKNKKEGQKMVEVNVEKAEPASKIRYDISTDDALLALPQQIREFKETLKNYGDDNEFFGLDIGILKEHLDSILSQIFGCIIPNAKNQNENYNKKQILEAFSLFMNCDFSDKDHIAILAVNKFAFMYSTPESFKIDNETFEFEKRIKIDDKSYVIYKLK